MSPAVDEARAEYARVAVTHKGVRAPHPYEWRLSAHGWMAGYPEP